MKRQSENTQPKTIKHPPNHNFIDFLTPVKFVSVIKFVICHDFLF